MKDYEQILDIVRHWPEDQRLLLLRELRRTLAGERPPLGQPRDTLSKALGLVTTDQAPPSDEDVKRWLDERRMEKYG